MYILDRYLKNKQTRTQIKHNAMMPRDKRDTISEHEGEHYGRIETSAKRGIITVPITSL